MIDLVELVLAQKNLQTKLGYRPEHMTQNERVSYIKENVLACADELHEALKEVGWKSWATSRYINPNAFFGELRDAWQFLTNLMLVIEPDPVTLAKRLREELFEKQAVNVNRHESGYDGVSDKCPSCSRSLSEVPITEVRIDDSGTVQYFCVCTSPLPAEQVGPYLDS